MTTDFTALRRRFSMLRERAYLATQCLGPLPDEALEDLEQYRRTLLLRSRGLNAWFERMHELTALFEQLLNAPQGSVASFSSATAAQGQLAAALSPIGTRRRIVITARDFHSSRYLWAAQQQRGFEIVEVADPAALLGQIDERVAIVACALVSPRNGALVDARALVRAAHAAGALVVLDAYQAVGAVPIDVRALDVDALVGGTHKWLCGGGTGLAFMYVRPQLAERLEPVYPGWFGHRELTGFADTFVPAGGAQRLQQGTPAVEAIYTARAGLRLVLDAGVEAIRARSLALTGRLLGRAAEVGLSPLTPHEPAARGGMVCFDVPDPPRAVETLAQAGIDIDSRPGAGVRMSPHACNSEEECDRAVDALAAIAW
ncbi:MAG: selenocysteine lyase [bacterium]|nr:selenocysteine lyase [bacterium]